MGRRHMGKMLVAGHKARDAREILTVWARNNGGTGTFYVSV